MRMFQGLVPVLGLDGIVAFCLSLMLLWELRNLERDLRPSKYRHPVNVVQDRYAQGEISLRELEQRVGEILEHNEFPWAGMGRLVRAHAFLFEFAIEEED